MSERFIVDDAGTLIDLVSRDTYDYVSDVCPVLNKLVKENEKLKQQLNLKLSERTFALQEELKR